jgi:hypothetical protein
MRTSIGVGVLLALLLAANTYGFQQVRANLETSPNSRIRKIAPDELDNGGSTNGGQHLSASGQKLDPAAVQLAMT